VSWADYDNDGWLDVFVGNNTAGAADLYRNEGGVFSFQMELGTYYFGTAAWGDYDNDGRVDVLASGARTLEVTNTITRLWRNTGNGFTNINAGLPGIVAGSVAWGDFDNDGLIDILLTGTNELMGPISQVWRNTGSGFTNIHAGLTGMYDSRAAWGDYDRDGCLDIVLSGTTADGRFVTEVWRNLGGNANSPPSAPTGLTVTPSNSTVILSWNASSDAETPANGLTYNVRIGSVPGGSDVLSAMASFDGTRKVAQAGNAGSRRFAVFNYTPGKPYYWTVQAIDSGFVGSAFAAEQNFRVVQPPPAVVPAALTNLIPGDTNHDGLLDGTELNEVLAYYFANSPWLMMTNVSGLGGTNVTFALTNDLSGAFSVEYTTDFVEWHFLGPAVPRYDFIDTNAPASPTRYYRLRWP